MERELDWVIVMRVAAHPAGSFDAAIMRIADSQSASERDACCHIARGSLDPADGGALARRRAMAASAW